LVLELEELEKEYKNIKNKNLQKYIKRCSQ